MSSCFARYWMTRLHALGDFPDAEENSVIEISHQRKPSLLLFLIIKYMSFRSVVLSLMALLSMIFSISIIVLSLDSSSMLQ
ncbi:hypothetical protein D3C71_1415250 [compost metagenome]